MRHDCEVTTKKSSVVRFPSLPDKMHDTSCNKETFYVEVTEDTHYGKNRWGLVFYGVKSKLLDSYRLGLKEPTNSSTLDDLGQFIAENGIPRQLIADSYSILGAGKKWKHVLGRKCTPPLLIRTR